MKTNKTLRILSVIALAICLAVCLGITAFAAETNVANTDNVAKVGNTEYATIDEAIANWTNGTTLTLLADVTLSDTIKLSSTEYHILDLGTYTMTAASKKDAIQIVNNGRTSASYALDIKADAENPGGITATVKAVVKTTGKSGVKDRPIIRFYNGVFTGTNVVYHSGSNGTNCPQFWFYGGEFNGTVYANRALFQFYGGTFNGSLQISVDSSAYALISGGRFKKLSNLYGSSLNSDKFTIGSSKGNYNRGIYVDAEGYYVVTSEVITEVSAKYSAVKKESYNSNNYFYYSAANIYGMFYEVASMAGTGNNVTIWEKPAITIPEDVTGDATVVGEIKNNTALKDYTPKNLPAGAELEIELVSVGDSIVYDVTPMANGAEVEPTEAITFRLPVPASVTKAYAKVYHDGTLMGIYAVQGEDNAKFVEVSSADFSEFAVEPTTDPAAKIGDVYYETLAEAVSAVKNGDTITLLADIYREVVTVSKAVTIDGAGKTFVGAMTLEADTTIKSVNFDGQNYNGYAITTRGANYLTIEDCTAKNYGYGFVQLASGTALTTLKNVTVSNMNYGVKVDYSNAVVLENVDMTAGVAAVLNSNYGDKTITIKDSKLNILGTWTRNNTIKTNYVFEGANTIDSFITDAAIDNFQLAAGATLKAPKDITVTTDVADMLVIYKDGMYQLKAPVAVVNGVKYAFLAEAIAAANAGDTITLLADITEDVTISKAITIDGADKTYTGAMTLKADTTIKNVNFDGKGYNGYAITTRGANYLTIENCTAKNYGFGFVQLASGTALTTLKNVTVSNMNYGVKVDYSNAVVLENVDMTAGVAAVLNSNYGEKTITIKNSKLNILGTWTRNNTIKTIYVFEGANTIEKFSTNEAIDIFVGVEVDGTIYGTLADAFAAAQDGDTVKLLGNIATSETITIADGKKITLDMNGKKITVTDNETKNYELFYIYGEMIVTGDGTIELTSTNNRAWNAMSAIFHNRGGVLTIENGTFKNLGGTDMAWVVDNSGNWYGDATTVINGGTLTSTYTAIRNRMEQNTHGASGKAILVINGGTINGTTSAIWAQAASTSTVAPATGSITVNSGNIGVINTARSNGAVSMTTINGGTVAGFKGETGELTVNGGKITGTITICHDNGDVAKYKVVKDGVYYAAVAKVGVKYYATLQEAVDACSAGGKITLVDNAKGPGVVINKSITINFANYTYTLTEGVGSTGTESNGFQILAGNKVTLSAGTLKVAEEAADKFYILIQNYADLSLFNMNLDGTYLDKWSKTDGDSYVISNNSGYISMTGKTYITTNDDGDKAFAFDACDSKYYADKPVVFVATTVKIDGKAVSESYDKIEAAARIGSTQFFASLKEAFAYASNGNTIKLMADVAVSEAITNTKKVTLDLNGKTITGTDNATGSFAIITNKGTLTITGNGKITLTAINNRGWNAYSSVISNTVGGKLIVESGTIEHLGGTDMAYAIDNLTNGKGTYAETVINGGTIKSTYRAIRMFLNGVEAQNILTINGGVVEGANKSVWMQDPSKNANTGNLTITKGATIDGDVYLTVTAGSTQWPVEVSIAASAVNGEVLTSNVPTGYKLVKTNGVYSVEKVKVYVAKVGVTKYESLQEAINACPAGGKVTILCDAKGPGVVINKNITILFNGHTYTITEPVGSAGTETLGFQILKGSKVVLNNGKIEIAEEAADKFAILIQNYGDLTVYQMNLDGTNLGRYENYSYVLSVNCGKVTVNGKSVLTAKDGEGNYALDVYDYSSAGYSLPTVTVTSVVKVNGKISAGAKYSTVYYATVDQAKAANPGKNVTVLN